VVMGGGGGLAGGQGLRSLPRSKRTNTKKGGTMCVGRGVGVGEWRTENRGTRAQADPPIT